MSVFERLPEPSQIQDSKTKNYFYSLIRVLSNNFVKINSKVDGLEKKSVQRNTTNTNITKNKDQWNGNTDGGSFTYNLPEGLQGLTFKIVNTGVSGNTLTVAPNGTEKILGVNSNQTLSDGESLIITYDSIDGWY